MTQPTDSGPWSGAPGPDPWATAPGQAQDPDTRVTVPGGQGGGPPQDWWSPPPSGSSAPSGSPPPAIVPPEPKRSALVVALVLIAILSGSALFASGFTLGLQQALAPGTPTNERDLFDPFWEAYRKITTEYVGQVEPKELVEGAIGGMFDAVDDPYSGYMTYEEYQESLDGISGEFEGIGAQMTTMTPGGGDCGILGPACELIVVDVIRDSPAEKAGLLADDRLTAVDGVPVEGESLDDVVARVKGPRGTEVVLTLLRGTETLELPIVRDVVRTEDVRAEVLADGTVGYLDVEGFSGSAAKDFRTLLKEQLDTGITRFVVDLRDDPGGFVDAALAIASEFIDAGPIYWEEYADGRLVPTPATGEGIATDPAIEVAVLINGGSASASEILAGALQDTGRARLVGERSFGKGTIQQWHLLANETGGFRLSVAKWLTPDRRWIHGEGLVPDVPISAGSTGTGTDPQLDAAVELLADDPGASPVPGASAVPVPSVTWQPAGSPQAMGWPVRVSIAGPVPRLA